MLRRLSSDPLRYSCNVTSNDRIVRSLLYSSANIYTEYLLGLIVSIVIARSLGPADFGVYALIVWVCALSITVINAGISVAAIKFTSELSGRGQTAVLPLIQRYLARIQLVKGFIFLTIFGLIALLAPGILVEEGQRILLWMVIPVVLFKSFHMFQVGIIKGHQEFRALARIAFIVAPLNILFVTVAYLTSPTIFGYLVAFVLTSIVYFLASNSSLKMIKVVGDGSSRTKIDEDLKARINKLLKYTSLIIILAYVVYGQSELLFLKHLGNASDLAFFSVGFVLARSASALVPGVYNNILLPRISYAVGKDDQTAASALMSASRHMLFLGLLCAVPIAVFAEDIVLFLYGEEYRAAYIPTMIFAIVAVLGGVRDTTNAYLVSVDAQPMILKIVAALFCGTIILDFFLIAEYGLLGGVVAYAVMEVIATAAISFFAYQRLGRWPEVNKVAKALAAAALSAGVAYSIGAALSFTGGFIIGAAVSPVAFIIGLFLFDAFDDDDYKIIQPLVSGRSDLFCKVVDSTVRRRLATSSRSL
ncbi:MAG: oligosaccharide flippase family protein [Hyphomicrobiaceae bacterium]